MSEQTVWQMSINQDDRTTAAELEIWEHIKEAKIVGFHYRGINDDYRKYQDANAKEWKALPTNKCREYFIKFDKEVVTGDLIVVKIGTDRYRGLAQIVGDYEYDEPSDIFPWHVRKVKWLHLTGEHPISCPIAFFNRGTLQRLGKHKEEFFAWLDVMRSEDGEDDERQSGKSTAGFQRNQKAKNAVEEYAMLAARNFYESKDFEVKDTSINKPYDLVCTKNDEVLHVEVKGTSSKKLTSVIVTYNEVESATKVATSLFIIYDISIDANYVASGGQRKIIKNWSPNDDDLRPISYYYFL